MSMAARYRLLAGWARRPCAGLSLVASVRVFLRRRTLDRLLAAGGDPSWDPDLGVRAAQITSWRERHLLADSLESAVSETHRPPRWSCAAPLDRRAVRAAAPGLLALAAELEAACPAAAEGVALTKQLVTEAGSPLYAPGDPDALREIARVARSALS
jgi:hypothetical protein